MTLKYNRRKEQLANTCALEQANKPNVSIPPSLTDMLGQPRTVASCGKSSYGKLHSRHSLLATSVNQDKIDF